MRLFFVILLLIIPFQAQAFERYNRIVKFDKYFSKYSKRFFGTNFNWRYFKAQAVAESGLRADAESKVGAKGLMQIMPTTYKEILRKNRGIRGSRFQPRWNIAAGIYYDRTLWNAWKAERPRKDRINFMFGSYNAGKGNIIRAQKVARGMNINENLWEAIEISLPEVTGKHSRETIGYVKKINKVKEVLR